MPQETIILWYRNDLRIHDHAPLSFAVSKAKYVIPVYVIDERQFETSQYGFQRTGQHRLLFLQQSVMTLRDQLRNLGSELIIRCGKPEEIVPALAAEYGASRVVYHEEAAFEEKQVEKQLQDNLLRNHIIFDTWWGATLTPKEDLPFTISHLPGVFTRFRSLVEKNLVFPPPIPEPVSIHTPIIQTPGEWPEQFACLPAKDERMSIDFKGGEVEALKRLNYYLWEGDHLRHYESTRNELAGPDFSTKFSPWLALGCLSPRLIHLETKRYEIKRISNKSTYWIIFELLWRDFFRFNALRYGAQLFALHGNGKQKASEHFDKELFDAWCEGRTGFPFVDACMRELRSTGFLSNRGRQNAASFFVHDLGLDWRAGAAWFESQLIDYDAASNWGNWAYIAGVGNDPRSNRYFNIPAQSERYDHNAEFTLRWCPELKNVPPQIIHHLHEYSKGFVQNFNLRIGTDYPSPVVIPAYINRTKPDQSDTHYGMLCS
ncbi:MAG: DASH family cryptochrome [Bacteroidia bacterium]|jgi:deoxyribodipyrimidine photo-lyase|nr:DASH family cryptochrome [Bacteroidia bacterium]